MAVTRAGGWACAVPVTTTPTITINTTTAANDILLIAVANGGDTATPVMSGTYTGSTPALIGGSSYTFGATTFNGSFWWTRCTGDHDTQTIIATTVDSGASYAVLARGATTEGAAPWETYIATGMDGDTDTLSTFSWTSTGGMGFLLQAFDEDGGTTLIDWSLQGAGVSVADVQNSGGNDTGVTVSRGPDSCAVPGSSGAITWTNPRALGRSAAAMAVHILPQDLPNVTMAPRAR